MIVLYDMLLYGCSDFAIKSGNCVCSIVVLTTLFFLFSYKMHSFTFSLTILDISTLYTVLMLC